jgi:hypothetical protein
LPYAPDLTGHALDDRYELHALVGEGAFGRVYRGRDRRLDRPVAVKVIKPWWAEDPDWAGTFEREARMLARVSDPGIVQIFDVGQAPEGVYYVSELVDGENLATRLKRGPLPAWEACGVAAQLCRALARAHAERIVHRDIKPANILLSSDGRVKVGDFGVARLAEASTDANGAHPTSIVGTPRYMAPEQGRGRPTTPATDIYSVGVVLYEMLSGSPPFDGESVVELALRHLQDAPPPLSPLFPEGLVEITERALAKDPADRFPDGAAMAEALVDARRRSSDGRRARLTPARSRNGAHTTGRQLIGAGSEAAGRSGGGGMTAAPRAPHEAGEPPRRPTSGAGSAGSGAAGGKPPRRPDETRAAPVMSPRRNVNPAGRRRAGAALGLVILLIGGMIAASAVLGAAPRTRVPRLTGMSSAGAASAARRAHLKLHFGARYDSAPEGVTIAQHPGTGARVAQGTAVSVVLSRGPAPVPVPTVFHQNVSDAQESLRSLGLNPTVNYVPAPGVIPGTVTGQSIAGGKSVAKGTSVALSVAETPQWRPVETFSSGRSGAFHIKGDRWRLVYSMGFQGTCTWIIFCSGPTARVVNVTTGQTVRGFGLQNGSNQTQSFASGAGTYEVQVTPGGDDAGWSVQVQDYY